MKLAIYQVDAFTDHLFAGNPAAVVPIGNEWPMDDVLQKVAIENNLSETAFFQDQGDVFELRWFTPEFEIDLCGHATLATAYVIFNHMGFPKDQIVFETMSGPLIVKRRNHLIQLDFPTRIPEKTQMMEELKSALSIQPNEVLKSRDWVLVFESESDVRALKLEASLDPKLFDKGGIVCTAKGDGVDFVSRFFFPGSGVLFEDPVTGSSHCSLIPYWSEKLGKKEMIAYQLSERKGYLNCTDLGDRVLIAGNAITYLIGEIEV